jgi:hypothetical protein
LSRILLSGQLRESVVLFHALVIVIFPFVRLFGREISEISELIIVKAVGTIDILEGSPPRGLSEARRGQERNFTRLSYFRDKTGEIRESFSSLIRPRAPCGGGGVAPKRDHQGTIG